MVARKAMQGLSLVKTGAQSICKIESIQLIYAALRLQNCEENIPLSQI